MQWNEALYHFYKSLKPPKQLPNNIEWLYPQQSDEVKGIVKQFLDKFYNDDKPRKLFLGINPGRFGAGVTGVNFTAPKQLVADCGIEHPFKMQSEISAEFIYDMINAYGGPAAFYGNYFIGSVCPLGFIKGGKNINYYDDKELLRVVEPFIVKSIHQLIQMPFDKEVCCCIGGEKNYKYLSGLNKQQGWFQQIVSLPHPRFIMQYKRKQKEEYVEMYLRMLE
jgi:hypothetical protein